MQSRVDKDMPISATMQNFLVVCNTSTIALIFTGDSIILLASGQTKSLQFSSCDYVVTAKDANGNEVTIATIKYPIDASSFMIIQGGNLANTGFTAKLQVGSSN